MSDMMLHLCVSEVATGPDLGVGPATVFQATIICLCGGAVARASLPSTAGEWAAQPTRRNGHR